MQINVSNCGSSYEDFHNLCEFQGEFKQRTDKDIENVMAKIIKYGFSFPMFVWEYNGKKYVVDGHGRLAALYKLELERYAIPKIPVVYIQAENPEKAIQILLLCNSRFGYITDVSADMFMEGVKYEDLVAGLNLDGPLVSTEELPALKPMDIFCPKCGCKCEAVENENIL